MLNIWRQKEDREDSNPPSPLFIFAMFRCFSVVLDVISVSDLPQCRKQSRGSSFFFFVNHSYLYSYLLSTLQPIFHWSKKKNSQHQAFVSNGKDSAAFTHGSNDTAVDTSIYVNSGVDVNTAPPNFHPRSCCDFFLSPVPDCACARLLAVVCVCVCVCLLS